MYHPIYCSISLNSITISKFLKCESDPMPPSQNPNEVGIGHRWSIIYTTQKLPNLLKLHFNVQILEAQSDQTLTPKTLKRSTSWVGHGWSTLCITQDLVYFRHEIGVLNYCKYKFGATNSWLTSYTFSNLTNTYNHLRLTFERKVVVFHF